MIADMSARQIMTDTTLKDSDRGNMLMYCVDGPCGVIKVKDREGITEVCRGEPDKIHKIYTRLRSVISYIKEP